MNNELIAKNKCIIITIILIFGISAGILGYFQYKESFISNPPVSPSASVNPSISPDNTLPSPEEVWKTYTNSELGFSIKYPKMVYGVYRCSPNKPFYVPLKVFEDNSNGTVYVAEEYYYDNRDSNTQNNTETCKKNIYSLESLTKEKESYGNPFLSRVFVIKSIKNDTELNEFIKTTYGSGCSVEKKTPWEPQGGVYKIDVKGEGWDKTTDFESTTCHLPMSTLIILYDNTMGKFMSVNLGQECGFGTDPSLQPYKCYDEEMINSFRFK